MQSEIGNYRRDQLDRWMHSNEHSNVLAFLFVPYRFFLNMASYLLKTELKKEQLQAIKLIIEYIENFHATTSCLPLQARTHLKYLHIPGTCTAIVQRLV